MKQYMEPELIIKETTVSKILSVSDVDPEPNDGWTGDYIIGKKQFVIFV